jgi:hypothetical protein
MSKDFYKYWVSSEDTRRAVTNLLLKGLSIQFGSDGISLLDALSSFFLTLPPSLSHHYYLFNKLTYIS